MKIRATQPLGIYFNWHRGSTACLFTCDFAIAQHTQVHRRQYRHFVLIAFAIEPMPTDTRMVKYVQLGQVLLP